MNKQEIGAQFRAEIENLIGQLQTAMATAVRGMDRRPAFSNWPTLRKDEEAFATVMVEPGQRLL